MSGLVGFWGRHEVQDSKALKCEYLKNEKSL